MLDMFSMLRGRREYQGDESIRLLWKCNDYKDCSGPHVVVYHGVKDHVAVLSTKGVYFPKMDLEGEVTNIWWYKGNLCVMTRSKTQRSPHVIKIWSLKKEKVVQECLGKRVWSKFRGAHAEHIQYPVRHGCGSQIQVLAPDLSLIHI